MAAATTTSSRCDACGANVGPWQASITITSECAHTFNLRFVSGGSAACPSCAAASKDAPATATPTAMATNSPSNLSGPPSETSPFGKQQATPKTTNTFGPGHEPSPAPCSGCGGAMGRGEATVTSECAHTFHLRCFSFSGSVCPACRARWRYEVTVKPSTSSSDPFLSPPPQPSSSSQPAGSTFAAPNKWAIPSSTPSFLSQPSPSSSTPKWPSPSFGQPFSSSSPPPPPSSLFSPSAGSTSAAANTTSSTATTRRESSVFPQPTDSSFNATLQSAPPAFGVYPTPAFS